MSAGHRSGTRDQKTAAARVPPLPREKKGGEEIETRLGLISQAILFCKIIQGTYHQSKMTATGWAGGLLQAGGAFRDLGGAVSRHRTLVLLLPLIFMHV